MTLTRKVSLVTGLAALLATAAPVAEVFAARTGSSFGGRSFRMPSAPRSSGGYRQPGGYSNGPSFVFLPSFGWGMGGFGFGGGGSLLMLAALGIGAFYIMRTIRRAQQRGVVRDLYGGGGHDDEESAVAGNVSHVHKLQLALGRSARGLQKRLADFAAEADTASEAGLAQILTQTSLELLREKDSIRYAHHEASGPLSLANGETKMNGMALKERSRFEVERVRGADGKVRRSDRTIEESKEVLEYVLVTLIVATRTPLEKNGAVTSREDVEKMLETLGGIPASSLFGLEVIWTPADENDSLTETDLLTSHPDLRSV